MAKQKNIDVVIEELTNNTSDDPVYQVIIADQVVGQVEEVGKQNFLASFSDQRSMKMPTFDQAVEYLISQFNLHGLKKN